VTARIALVTDSTCDLPVALAEDRQFYIASLHIMWGQDNLKDRIDIVPEQFFERLAGDSELPTTSQPTPAAFADLYQQAIDETGAEAVLAMTISSDLSGTYASAQQAAKMVDFPVETVDLRTASIATSLSLLRIADLRDQGASLAEATALAQSYATRTKLVFFVDTLEYLHKGGRIGGARRLLGTALNIKPVLHIVNGQIEARESVRTRKRAMNRLIDIFGTEIDPDQPLHVGILHGQAKDDAHRLEEVIQKRWQPDSVLVSEIGSVIGVHTGPGPVGFAILQ
jgi:DegV family protein with EDD domain